MIFIFLFVSFFHSPLPSKKKYRTKPRSCVYRLLIFSFKIIKLGELIYVFFLLKCVKVFLCLSLRSNRQKNGAPFFRYIHHHAHKNAKGTTFFFENLSKNAIGSRSLLFFIYGGIRSVCHCVNTN